MLVGTIVESNVRLSPERDGDLFELLGSQELEDECA